MSLFVHDLAEPVVVSGKAIDALIQAYHVGVWAGF